MMVLQSKTTDRIDSEYEAKREQLSKRGFADGISIKKVLRDQEHMRSKSLGGL